MTGSVNVSKAFVADFEKVATHYELRKLGQYDDAKQAARNDLDNAQATYAALSEDIRKGNA